MLKASKYRIRNWSEYNRSLIQRGNITVWFSEEALDKWHNSKPTGEKGRPQTYSDDAILTCLTLKSVFHCTLRATQGLLESVAQLMRVAIAIPSYTQLSRRAMTLGKQLEKISRKRPTALVIDSTGLKIYGEGEWKVRQHGYSKRRVWKKLHLAVCPDSQEIIVESLTEHRKGDCQIYPELIEQAPRSVAKTYTDGAYDTEGCYYAAWEADIEQVVTPKRNAVYQLEALLWQESRNNAILEITGLGGNDAARSLWKKLKGYHIRSLAETAMFRFKTLFGAILSSRKKESQQTEVLVKCRALNTMTRLGMPIGEWV